MCKLTIPSGSCFLLLANPILSDIMWSLSSDAQVEVGTIKDPRVIGNLGQNFLLDATHFL